MPIFEIDDETIESLGDEIKAKLSPYTPEDTTGLKDKANKLLKEKKDLQAQIRQMNEMTDGDESLKSRLADSERQRNELQAKINETNAAMARSKIMAEAAKLASRATSDPDKHELLTEKYAKRIDFDADGVVILDEHGNASVSKLEDLESEYKKRYSFFFDGSKATGGGAQGNTGGAGSSQKTMKRSAFTALSPAEKHGFMSSGGTLTD